MIRKGGRRRETGMGCVAIKAGGGGGVRGIGRRGG